MYKRQVSAGACEAAQEKTSLHDLLGLNEKKDEPKRPTLIHMFDSG